MLKTQPRHAPPHSSTEYVLATKEDLEKKHNFYSIVQYYDELLCQAKFHASFRNLTQMSKGTEKTQKGLANTIVNSKRLSKLEKNMINR